MVDLLPGFSIELKRNSDPAMVRGRKDTTRFCCWLLGSKVVNFALNFTGRGLHVPRLHPGPRLAGRVAGAVSRARLRPFSFLSCRLHMINFVEPVGLNFSMFIPTLLNQGTTAQKEKWLRPAQGLQIIGTYAQTELGHG